jgi:hypothetical protein
MLTAQCISLSSGEERKQVEKREENRAGMNQSLGSGGWIVSFGQNISPFPT